MSTKSVLTRNSVLTSNKIKNSRKDKEKTDNKKSKDKINDKINDKITVKTPPKKTTKNNDKNQMSITQFVKKCVKTINSINEERQLDNNNFIKEENESKTTISNLKNSTNEQKRKLTFEEKENICDFLTLNPGCDFEHAVCIIENTKRDILNQLDNIEIYPSLIPSLKNEIIHYYNHSQIQPGQMVGVDSATSLGEPTTQMSVVKNELVNIVKVRRNSSDISFISSSIGKFCDDIIKQYPEYTFNTHSNETTKSVELTKSVETDLKHLDYDYYVVSVNKNEKTEWNRISHVSRHPVNGQIVKVKTKSGRTIETTLSHSHLTRKDNLVVPIKGSELKIGMRIPVCKFISDKFTIAKDKALSKTCNITKQQYDEHSIFYLAEDIAYSKKNYKNIPNSVFLLPNKLKKVFIKTIFDILSVPTIDNEYENYEIELVSSKQIVYDLALLLNYFGIFSKIQMINITDDKYKLTIPNQYIPIFNLIISQNHKINNDYILYNKTDNGLDSIDGINEILIKCVNVLKLSIPDIFTTTVSRKTITNFLKIIDDYDCSKIANEVKLLKQAIYSDIVWDEIVELDIYTPPQDEFVYDFTVPGCETFLLNCGILTHNTLNSISYDDEILLKINNEIKITKIGEYIDNYFDKAKKTEEHPNNTKLLYINDDEDVFVPSVDDNGITLWKRVQALTRHPVINKDGTNTVLKVTTNDGRQVTATKAKSFLTINGYNKIVGLNGDELKIGDYLPVNQKQFDFPEKDNLDLSKLFNKKEYVFGSEVYKALKYKDIPLWWKKHSDKDFILPYKRSDIFLDSTKSKNFKDGILYLKNGIIVSEIPEKIPYDFDFGYLIGAYLADGCSTETQISISKNDREFLEPIERLMNKWNITTKYYVHKDKNQDGWVSSDLRIYSTLLTKILYVLCGKGSENKSIHNELFNSNKEFLKGILSGYIGGDGTIDKNTSFISICSVSRKLLENIQSILCWWFGVYSGIRKLKKQEKNNRGSENILQTYNLYIKSEGTCILSDELKLFIKSKQELLDKYKSSTNLRELNDIIPKYNYNGKIYEKFNRVTVEKKHNIKIFENLRFDKVIEIEEIQNPTEWVYDLTVEDTRTFSLVSGLKLFDTFHSAGKACAAVTTGVPRFRELIDASKQQKHTLISFSLNDKENEKIKEMQDAKRICRQFDEKRIISLLQISIPEISNYKYNNLNDEDKSWYSFFETFIHSDFKKFNWSLRFKFNKDSLFEYRITLKHISYSIEKELGNCICVYSPDNIGIIDVYIDVSNIKKDDLLSYRKQIDTIKKNEKKKTIIDENNKYYYYIRDIIFQYICNIKVSGIDCIEKGYFRQEKINGMNKWIFDLEGTNYREILNHPLINYKDCMVNNMWELFNVLGIEAVRRFLINEFNEVITSGGINVDKTHLELLADSMTCTGNITSVSRYGIGRNETGPLTKASFEQSLDNMLIAAYRSETESIKSVSSSIILGQCSRIGSGMMELYTNIKPVLNTDDLYDDSDIDNETDNEDRVSLEKSDNIPVSTQKETSHKNEEFIF